MTEGVSECEVPDLMDYTSICLELGQSLNHQSLSLTRQRSQTLRPSWTTAFPRTADSNIIIDLALNNPGLVKIVQLRVRRCCRAGCVQVGFRQ